MPENNKSRNPAGVKDTLFAKLRDIQSRLRSPKDQRSEEGWSYRSAEDIIRNLRPLLQEHGLHIRFEEWPVMVGGWNYITCILTLSDDDGNSIATRTAIREHPAEVNRSASQITGSCITYAHKAALSDLFALDSSAGDDMEDPDRRQHTVYNQQAPAQSAPQRGDSRIPLYEGAPEWNVEINRIRNSKEPESAVQGRLLATYQLSRQAFARLMAEAGRPVQNP